MTSLPGRTPAATNAQCSAAEPLLTGMTYLLPRIRQTRPKAWTLVSLRARIVVGEERTVAEILLGDRSLDALESIGREPEPFGDRHELGEFDLKVCPCPRCA